MRITNLRLVPVCGLVAVALSCGGDRGVEPTPVAGARLDAGETIAGGQRDLGSSANSAPVLDFRIKPKPVPGDPPKFFETAPFAVKINVCNSTDPDPGDSLRSDVNWGDGNETGPHNPGAGTSIGDGGPATGCDGFGCCFHRHTYTSSGVFMIEARLTTNISRTSPET